MSPQADAPQTTMNSAMKKKSVLHSIFSNAWSTSTLQIHSASAAPDIATTQGCSPTAPCTRKPRIVRIITIPPRIRLLRSEIAARSSSSMMSARFSTVTRIRFE